MKKEITLIKNNFLMDKSVMTEDYYKSFTGGTEVMDFHKTFKEYSKTPMYSLKNYAKKTGVGNVYVKDESKRFSLNAFKVLGASYAIGKLLAKKLNKDISDITFDYLASDEAKKEIGDLVLSAATDGNHGRGVAWTANRLSLKSVIYMPKGSTENRLNNIKELGAEALITDVYYDDTVRIISELSKKNGWEIVQDTAWKGYEDVPKWIMQGYSTIGNEVVEDLGEEVPTHIFLQAGVGAFAGVMICYFTYKYKNNPPKFILVEPENAACFYESAIENKITNLTGELETIMAGLACGEPNPMAYDIISKYCDVFLSVSDEVTEKGMRILGRPLSGDEKIVSGESGAVGMGALDLILNDTKYKELKEELDINEKSKVLIISTEGNTDPEVYDRIVNSEGRCQHER
ncbi:MAG: diaminopropionate ammonia-lyase [Clostridiaceae bacterium]